MGDETARDIFALRPGVDSAAVPSIATPRFWEQAPAGTETDDGWRTAPTRRDATRSSSPCRVPVSGPPTGNNDPYDVDLDDERFLMARVYGSGEPPTVVLAQNLVGELERQIPD